MKRKQKRLLQRIAFAVLIYVVEAVLLNLLSAPLWVSLLLYLIPYFIVGYDVLLKALRNILSGHVFDENFLMCIATVGAFCIGEYLEAVFVMLFYQIGELFQSIAVGKSRRSIASLMDIKPEQAVVIKDGQEQIVEPEELEVGDTVIVRAGEKIPIDGVITKGATELDCRALTGESVPRYAECGSRVASGCINLSGTICIEATSKYEDSTVSKILELVENASSLKSKTDRFITRFATYYTPIVVVAAMLVFLIPSLLFGNALSWLGRALIFLVISCPCALVISVPLSYFGGIGAASKNGILVKGAVYLEQLADVHEVVFDKTGTLTKGEFEVSFAKSYVIAAEFYSSTASLERHSTHPIAKAVCKYCVERGGIIENATDVCEIAGMGITARFNGEKYFAGNKILAARFGVTVDTESDGKSIVFVGKENVLFGFFAVKDSVKNESLIAVERLKRLGVKNTVMLSGDKKETVTEIADELGIDVAIGELLPDEKVTNLEKRLNALTGKQKLVYVGDGINDAPVLSRADIGIAMGAMGSDAAIEAADVVLMDDSPLKIATAVKIAKSTKKIVIQNIVFALGVKLAFMILGVVGIANLWSAVFADVGVSVIAILNAMRTLKLK